MTSSTKRLQELQQKLADHELTEEECHEYRAGLENMLDTLGAQDVRTLAATLVIGAINNRLAELRGQHRDTNRTGDNSKPVSSWWQRWWGQ